MRECLPDANAQVDPEERCNAAEVEAHAFLKVNDLLLVCCDPHLHFSARLL